MTISPDIHILSSGDLDKIRNAAFQRGVDRGRFERSCEAPFDTAMQIIELGCSLFWGRNGDGTHMESDEYREAHMRWYEKASEFVKAQRDKSAQSTA